MWLIFITSRRMKWKVMSLDFYDSTFEKLDGFNSHKCHHSNIYLRSICNDDNKDSRYDLIKSLWPNSEEQIQKFLGSNAESNNYDLPLMQISLAASNRWSNRWSSSLEQKESLTMVDWTKSTEFTRMDRYNIVHCFTSTLLTPYNIIQT